MTLVYICVFQQQESLSIKGHHAFPFIQMEIFLKITKIKVRNTSVIYIYISGDFLGCHKFEGQKYFEFRK